MTIDKQEIKALALACDPAKCADKAEEGRRLAEFYSESTPEVVLALLAEIEQLAVQVRLAGVAAEVTVHQEVGRAVIQQLSLAQERDQLKAENEALAHLLKRFVDGEHNQDEDQNERHDYHGEAESLLMRIGGEFREYSLVSNEILFAQYEQLNALRKDAARYRWLRDQCGIVEYKAIAGSIGPGMLPSGEKLQEAIDAAMAKEASRG